MKSRSPSVAQDPNLLKRKREESELSADDEDVSTDDDSEEEDDTLDCTDLTLLAFIEDEGIASGYNNAENAFETEWDPEHNRYDAEDHVLEPDPNCVAYQPAYRKSDQEILGFLKTFPLLDSLASVNWGMKNNLRNFNKAKEMVEPKPVRIAFLGEAGKGKSSTLNSLLDKIGLTETGANGTSETNVIYEYSSGFYEQGDPYGARVVWHSAGEIRKIVKGLRKRYQNFHFKFNPDWSDEEKRSHGDAAQNSLQTLCDVFCDHDSFADETAAKKFLADAETRDRKEVLSEMVSWALANVQKHQTTQRDTKVAAQSTFELRKKLAQYVSPPHWESDEARIPSIWQFVKVVRTGLLKTRVLEAFTPVDMPGRADRNAFRVGKTNAYLKKCDGSWIVANCDRVCDNESVAFMLREIFENYSDVDVGNIALVCTHSDTTIDDKLLQHLARVKAPGFDADKCKEWKKDAASAKDKIQELKRKLQNADEKEKEQLLVAKAEAQTKFHDAETKKLNHATMARALHIEKEAQKKYAEYVPSGRVLQVRCVSNYGYEKLKHQSDEAIELNAETTRIPALRELAMEMGASRIRKAKQANYNNCLTLLLGVELYLDKTQVDDPKELIRLASKPKEEIIRHVDRQFKARKESLATDVLKKLEVAQDEFRERALEIFGEWNPTNRSKWHASTFRTFCRHRGSHETKRKKYTRWNDELLEPFNKCFTAYFGHFEDAQKLHFDKMSENIVKSLRTILSPLEHVTHSQISSLEKFLEVQEDMLRVVLDEERDRQTQLQKDVWVLASKDAEKAYFSNAMVEAYDRCTAVKGEGSTDIMVGIIQAHLQRKGDNSTFSAILRGLDEAFEVDHLNNKGPLVHKISEIFDNVVRALRSTLEDESEGNENLKLVEKARGDLKIWLSRVKPALYALGKRLENARNLCN